jgi:hypothetical protein
MGRSLEHLKVGVPDAATERMMASHLIASLARLAEQTSNEVR